MTPPGPDGPDSAATTRLPRIPAGPDPEAETGPLPQVPGPVPARGPQPGGHATAETELIGRADGAPGHEPAETAETERIAPVEGAAGTEGAKPAERSMPTLMEQMGGVPGIISSTVPIAVFVVANILFDLRPALIAAIAAGVLVAIWRIARKQPLQPAISGLVGVGVCAFIAYRTGEARGFYLPGLLYSAGLALAFLVSIIVRWPLAGVIWNGINGHGQGWRKDRRMLRAYTWASAVWTLVFAARLVVQGLLYNADEDTWLGIARLVMGYPLFAVAIVVTIVAVRRAENAEKAATT
ncbi:hypothetical protein GCM10009836_41270 [Pseudonocardia ailaonensis]|uniref:DUF3159 domain-containing protein n=1 Tax=Pseudonocardia ailaonensis TaxID=367279 RepID=A0ABN2N7U5_9PSEU